MNDSIHIVSKFPKENVLNSKTQSLEEILFTRDNLRNALDSY